MNKQAIGDKKNPNKYKHSLRIMRTTLFLLFSSILFSQAAISYSQEFTFHSNSISIKEVCREIERNSDFIFVFSDNSEKMIDRKISLDASSEEITEVLKTILSNTGLTYRILDKQIVIYESRKETPCNNRQKNKSGERWWMPGESLSLEPTSWKWVRRTVQ